MAVRYNLCEKENETRYKKYHIYRRYAKSRHIYLDEINHGLSRLESEGYFQLKGSFMLFTEKSKRFEEGNRRRKENMIDKQLRYSEIFSKIPLTRATDDKEYFSSEEYFQAVSKYCR